MVSSHCSSQTATGRPLRGQPWHYEVMRCAPIKENWLAIDGAQTQCSIAIQLAGVPERHELYYPQARGHAELLPAMLDQLCTELCLKPNQLKGLACCVGPGAFTGLRISVALAQGLGFGWGLPLVAVSSLGAISFGAAAGVFSSEAGKNAAQSVSVLASFDARLGEVYVGGYRFWSGDEGNVVRVSCWLADRVLNPVALRQEVLTHSIAVGRQEPLILVGSGATLLPDFSDCMNQSASPWDCTLRARDVLGLALLGSVYTPVVGPSELLPAYVRDAVAKPPARLRDMGDEEATKAMK